MPLSLKFIVLLLLPLSLNAQKKYQLTFEQKANYSVYNFTAPSTYSKPDQHDLRMRLGFESEIRLYYTPKKKLSYYAGIGFTKYNYRWGKWDIFYKYSDQIIPKPGFVLPKYEAHYSYNYLSFPIGIKYSIGRRWVAGGGVRILRLLSDYSYSKLYYPDGRVKSYYNQKKFWNEGDAPWALNLEAEVGYTAPVFKYHITWKAAFAYALTDYFSNKYPALNLYPYTFGLGASFPLAKF